MAMPVHHQPDPDNHEFAKPAEASAIFRLLLILPIAGCLDSGPQLSETRSAMTVSGAVSSGCSTAVVLGLSRQIADQIACDHPGGMVAVPPNKNLILSSSAALLYLEPDAADDLVAEAVNHTVRINSAMRTLAQQYLLVQWFNNGTCGIAAVARVGHSNHESGRAIDVANYSSLISSMSANGWDHDVPGDVVHFDHNASDDIRNRDVFAFQELWNANNPADKIAVDGAYGPQTEARLKKSPTTGFAKGASCGTQQQAQAELASVDGPDEILTGTKAHYVVSLSNNSQTDWPDGLELQIDGATSQLYDASWISQTVVGALPSVVAGDVGTVEFDVTAPQVSDDLPVQQTLTLTDGADTYGTVTLAVTVAAHMDTSGGGGTSGTQSSDGGDAHDFGELTGGCNTGSGGGSLGIALALIALRRRRR